MINSFEGYGNERPFEPGRYRPLIVVQFDDERLYVPYNKEADSYLRATDEAWKKLLDGTWQQTEDRLRLELAPIWSPENAACLQHLLDKLERQGAERYQAYALPNYFTYFYLTPREGEGADKERLQKVVDMLSEFDYVKLAYVDQSGPDPQGTVQDESRLLSETLLGPAPAGINARCAWDQAGGSGDGIHFIDLEGGWTLNHDDLVHLGINLVTNPFYGDIKKKSRQHGTAVLGVVCAALNKQGGTGVAPGQVKVGVCSHFRKAKPLNDFRHDALVAALCKLDAGDVLLIEVQVNVLNTNFWGPVDVLPLIFIWFTWPAYWELS